MLKTRCIFTFLLLISCLKLSGQQLVPDTTAKKSGIKTAVKKTFFGNSKAPSMTYTEYYDTNGMMTQRISFNNHFNSISTREFFFYNKQGQLIKEQSIHYSSNDSTISEQSYSYNSNGQLDKNFKGKINYKYDYKGRVIESIEKTVKPGDLKTVYSYDSLGYLKSTEQYFYNSIDQRRTLDYNDKGQIIKETSSFYYSQENIPTSEYENTFVYFENGLVMTEYQKQTIIPATDNKADNRVYAYEYTFY